MKKTYYYIIPLIILFCIYASPLLAQKDQIWGDIGIARKYTVRDWNPNKQISRFMYTNSTSISTSLNWMFSSHWGGWARVSLEIHNDAKKQRKSNGLKINPFDPDRYYIKNVTTDYLPNYLNVDLALGGFYRFKYQNWAFMPFLGIGVGSYTIGDLNYIAKEKGTNNAYNVEFNRYYNDDSLETVLAELGLNVNYNIGRYYAGLGFRYQQHFQGTDLNVRITDYYGYEVIEEKKYRGRAPITLVTEFRIGFHIK